MKYSEIRKTKRYRAERAADGKALTKSAFEVLLVFIVLIFLAAFVFTVCFRVVTFSKKLDNRLQTYSVVTLPQQRYEQGDIVSVKTENNISAGEILALEGEKIVIGTDRSKSVNCVQYKGTRYFTYDELREEISDLTVPKGYALLNGDFTSSEQLLVGELVPLDYITGKASFVIYPFSLFGRSADYMKQ